MAAAFDAAASGLGPLAVIDFESAPVGPFNNLAVADNQDKVGLSNSRETVGDNKGSAASH